MIDFETLGTRPGSALLSLGAAFFSPTGPSVLDNIEKFYMNIDRDSCFALEMTVDESTLEWWNSPDKEAARATLLEDPRPISEVMEKFTTWFRVNGGRHVWSQGSCFDVILAEDAMRRVGIVPPWKFWDILDTRTVYHMSGLNPRVIKREGIHHNALDDVEHQIRCVHAAFRKR